MSYSWNVYACKLHVITVQDSLGCKALSEKSNNQFREFYFHGGFKLAPFADIARVCSKPVNPWIDNFLNASIS